MSAPVPPSRARRLRLAAAPMEGLQAQAAREGAERLPAQASRMRYVPGPVLGAGTRLAGPVLGRSQAVARCAASEDRRRAMSACKTARGRSSGAPPAACGVAPPARELAAWDAVVEPCGLFRAARPALPRPLCGVPPRPRPAPPAASGSAAAAVWPDMPGAAGRCLLGGVLSGAGSPADRASGVLRLAPLRADLRQGSIAFASSQAGQGACRTEEQATLKLCADRQCGHAAARARGRTLLYDLAAAA